MVERSGAAVWSPYNALLSAFPFIGAQAMLWVAAMAADAPYMKFVKYRVDAETGDLLISLGLGLGGADRPFPAWSKAPAAMPSTRASRVPPNSATVSAASSSRVLSTRRGSACSGVVYPLCRSRRADRSGFGRPGRANDARPAGHPILLSPIAQTRDEAGRER